MPLQRNTFVPQDLVAVYSSPSGMTDTRTGYPYQAGGLMPGEFIDLTEDEAQLYGRGQLHEGRYRFVKIDSAATAANIARGTIALMKSLALGVNVMTSYDKGLGTGAVLPFFGVFLAPVTAAQIAAGAYVWVQEKGDASVLAAGAITCAGAGVSIQATTNGVVNNGTTSIVGVSLEAAVISTLFRVTLQNPTEQG